MRQQQTNVFSPSTADTQTARRLTTLAILFAFLPYLVAGIRGHSSLLKIGSYNLCAEDVAVIVLVVALISRIDVGRISLSRVLLAFILLIAFFNLAIGVSGGNSYAALFEFRNRAVALLFFGLILSRWGTLRPGEYLRLPLVAGAVAFLLLYAVRLVGGPLLLVDPESFGALHAEYMEARLINAEAVIFLGAAAIFFLSEAAHQNLDSFRKSAYWALAAVCFLVVLVSRQRTGTVAVIAGLCIFLLLHPTQLGGKRALRLLAGVALLGALLVVAITVLGDVLEILPESFRESISRRDTFYGRVEIWTSSLAAYSSWSFRWRAFGRPAGEPLIVLLDQGEWEYSIHSAYLGLLLNYGFVGAALWAALLLAALIAALRSSQARQLQTSDLAPSVAASWLVILLIYGVSYEWRNGAAVFLGIAMIPLIRHRGRAKSRPRIIKRRQGPLPA
jgi:O-antigen ligase